jgi:hypothetical protein
MASPRRPLPLLRDLAPAPALPHQGTPERFPGSVRRTSHLNMTWPDGRDRDMHIDAAARDLLTTGAGQAIVADTAELHVTVDGRRVLQSVASVPHRGVLAELVGHGGGSGYRAFLHALIPDELTAGSLLYFLLDDMPGATLVGPFAWRMWPTAMAEMLQRPRHRAAEQLRDICSGFRSDGTPIQRMMNAEDPRHNLVPAHDLAQPDDPLAWHPVPPPAVGSAMMRRRRRVDVVAGPQLTVDALFRDSIWTPDGVETVVHEYGLRAAVNRESLRLASIEADPRVLPFPTCPAAARNVNLLVGEPLRTLRHRVLELVVGTDGCTHLNDALRALAEVPVLMDELTAADPASALAEDRRCRH